MSYLPSVTLPEWQTKHLSLKIGWTSAANDTPTPHAPHAPQAALAYRI